MTDSPCTDRERDSRRSSHAVDLDAVEHDLTAVEVALNRLADGTYWTDEVTGQPIPERRARRQPTRPARLMQKKAVASIASIIALAAGLAAAAQKAKESPLTSRFNRSARVWKLSARNSARFAVSRVRGIGSAEERRAQLDEQFAIRTAEDVAKELGEMKGVLMKAGQLISFIFEALPDEAQEALATLQSDAAPMAPTLAANVVKGDFGKPPERLFLDWSDMPVAAASIGQVHRAITHDGRDVAVKVQYPGVHEAIESDLDAAEVMYAMFSSMMLKGLDAKGLVDELRDRMREELDYSIEAGNVAEFEARFQGHPWVRIPKLVPELCSARVLTTEWIDGMTFDQFRKTASSATKQRAGGGHLAIRAGRDHAPRDLQRRPPSRQLQVPPRRQRLVPRLRAREALVAGRMGIAAPDRRRDHHRPRPRPARRGDGRVELPARRTTASSPPSCTTTCRARTSPTSPTSSRSPATGCVRRSGRSSTCRARTPR